MGITIHFDTEFRGTKNQLAEKLKDLIQFAQILNFKEAGNVYAMDYASDFDTVDKLTRTYVNEKTNKVEIDGSYRWAKIQAEPQMPWVETNDSPEQQAKTRRIREKMKAEMNKYNGFVLSLWWGEGCEATNLCFIRKGNSKIWKGHSFTKTQFATEFAKCHATICTFLKAAVRIGVVNRVYDEAEYYETEDVTTLLDSCEENLKMIRDFAKMLTDNFEENVIATQPNLENKIVEFEL